MDGHCRGKTRCWARAAFALALALALWCVLWEGWLAPLRPGGSWLTLKALPIAAALPGLWRGRRYTAQWASLMTIFYVAEGVMRWGDPQGVGFFAKGETFLALALFAALLVFARRTGRRGEDEAA
jgi:uncharacterized membrane protein